MADIQAEFEIVEPEFAQPSFMVVDDNGVQKVEIIGFEDPKVSASDIAGREVTVRKSIVLGNGRININELTAYVENKVASVNAMDVATADEQDIKKAQATLNKTASELSGVRIAMQKVWSQPFEENIAGPIKKLVAFIDEQKQPIANKLNEISEAFKTARLAEIAEIKDERLAKESEAVDKFIRSLPWFDDEKWLNKGATNKKITSEIDAKVVQVASDIAAIGLLNSDNPFGSQLMEVYRNNGGNLANTLLERKRLEEAAEQYARVQADIRARQEAERVEREKADAEAKERREAFAQGGTVSIGATEMPKFMRDEPEMVIDLPPAPEQEKRYVVTFKIKATKNQVSSVISHMKGLGVAYSLVDHKEA